MTKFVVTDEILGRLSLKEWELYRRVKEGTLDPERIIDDLQELIEGKTFAVSGRPATHALLSGYYNPPSAVLVQLENWNKQFGLGFSEQDFARVANNVPAHNWSQYKPLVLTWTLGTLAATLRAKANILEQLVKVYYMNPILFEEQQVRLSGKHKFEPNTLEWAVIDLAANWDKRRGIAPNKCFKQRLAGVELLDVATQHPLALKAQDSSNMPYWTLGAIEADPDGGGSFRGVACLGWNRFGLDASLAVGSADSAGPGWSVPVRES